MRYEGFNRHRRHSVAFTSNGYMLTRISRRVYVAALGCLACWPLWGLAQRLGGIEIHVAKQASSEIDRYYPGGLEFVGTAVNPSSTVVVIQSAQGPGGFAGTSVRFQCALEQWEPSRRVWTTEPPPIREDSGPYSTPFKLRPNQPVRACWRAFQPLRAAGKARFRFHLWSTFARTGESWTSEEFETTMRPIR